MATVIAIACLVAIVVTQGIVAFALIHNEKEKTPDRKVIRTGV